MRLSRHHPETLAEIDEALRHAAALPDPIEREILVTELLDLRNEIQRQAEEPGER